MQRCHQEALKKNRVMLAKQLVLNVLVEHMVEKDIITAEMVEMIQVRGLSPEPWALFLAGLGVVACSGSMEKAHSVCHLLPARFSVIALRGPAGAGLQRAEL